MKWYHLTPVQWIILIVFIAIVNLFTITQRYMVPEMIKPLAYVMVVIVLFLVFFFIIRPDEPSVLSQTLAIILGVIAIMLIIIQDVIIAFNLSWKTVVIFLGAILAPYIDAYLYRVLRVGHRSG
ncbi:MAG: hypothetical protein WC502_02515 [Methanolinea sp.]|jgi:Na+-translocating ferredoxin:NAD+ oxidoreductase RnfD subunit